jgi:adenine-specific DNA-methyltransferase
LAALTQSVDFLRIDANRKLDPERRSALGQFMTPEATARLMASMFRTDQANISLLDAGAGIGSLTAAFVEEMCARSSKPVGIEATAYEIDPVMIEYLGSTLDRCGETCENSGVNFRSTLIAADFIDEGARKLRAEMFAPVKRFNCAILNPPYKKIASDSGARTRLRELGIETSNLYTGFLSVALLLLEDGGEMVAITPRSFCNGPYFKPFRKLLLESLTIRRLHVFESRQVAFQEDEVLQENVIFYGVKRAPRGAVTISSSAGPADDFSLREIPYDAVVRPTDSEYFIHIVPDELGASIAEQIGALHWSLAELDLEVSTGRVVDFRVKHLLREEPGVDTFPLIYPLNLEHGYVSWPRLQGKKPQGLLAGEDSMDLLLPNSTYVLTKRFSSKEESRRVVAAVHDPEKVSGAFVGFENHLNYFHRHGSGLPPNLARGLAAFLNSTLLDLYFRQFSGHTQVNATDLRNLRYPTRSQLEALGNRIGEQFPAQDVIDRHVDEVLKLEDATGVADPVKAKKKIDEALAILKDLGVPREQQNERSALTLLSLLELKPAKPWSEASDPLMGITPMMEFFETYYGKKYAPNTRETIRRQTIHQFLDAGIVNINPDNPERPTNSPYAVYRIEPGLLELLRSFGKRSWKAGLKTYLASVETLKKRYAQEREMKRIPVQVAKGKTISLSPGRQNVLVERIIKDFCEFFTGGGRIAYVGDTDEKWAYFDEGLLQDLGIAVETHGKMPDVIVYLEEKKWLVLVEAVTSHGPVNPKRHGELKTLFKGGKAGLVFVTAFLDRQSMRQYLGEISWETEVWVADAPTHLIHFNGERFLGPYLESPGKSVGE